MIASPRTIETAIRTLEEQMKAVREGYADPPQGYTAAEWLRESHRQLQTMKRQRLQMPIG